MASAVAQARWQMQEGEEIYCNTEPAGQRTRRSRPNGRGNHVERCVVSTPPTRCGPCKMATAAIGRFLDATPAFPGVVPDAWDT